jgi:hypothetical protein
MQADKQEVLKRLNYIEGHLGGIRKMIEEDKYCVDILRQTYAVRNREAGRAAGGEPSAYLCAGRHCQWKERDGDRGARAAL